MSYPLYQFLYDGEAPPTDPAVAARVSLGQELWGNSDRDARRLRKLRMNLSRLNDRDRRFLLSAAMYTAQLRYLQNWIDQLRWQRLVPFQNLGFMLLDHLDGILNYCRTKVRFGVVEAINDNIKTLFRRGRGYKNLGYLLLKAQRMAVAKTEFIVLQKAA